MNDETPKPGKSKSQARRAGQIVERGPNKFLLRIFLGRDTTGKRHYHDETFHGKKKAAEERLRTLLTKHAQGEPLKLSKDTLNAFLDEWLQTRLDLKESSQELYARILSLYVRPKLGGLLLNKIDAADVQALYAGLAESKLSASSLDFVHTLLKSAFKLAVRRRKVVFNPMDGVDKPGGKKAAQEKQERLAERIMTPDQVDSFLNAADESRFGVVFSLAFHTGCRPGELLGLKWEDLDNAARTLTIRRAIHWRKGGEWYLDVPKTAHGRRVLRLGESLLELLGVQRKRQLEERMRAGKAWNEHGFIFANEIGEPYSQHKLRYLFKQILQAAGLPDHFNPYSARHTSATMLMGGGVNPKTVSQRLGHSTVKITLDTYTHPTDDMQTAASDELERVIGRRK